VESFLKLRGGGIGAIGIHIKQPMEGHIQSLKSEKPVKRRKGGKGKTKQSTSNQLRKSVMLKGKKEKERWSKLAWQ